MTDFSCHVHSGGLNANDVVRGVFEGWSVLQLHRLQRPRDALYHRGFARPAGFIVRFVEEIVEAPAAVLTT